MCSRRSPLEDWGTGSDTRSNREERHEHSPNRVAAQLAADKLRLATQIETAQQALALVVSSASAEWREELIQAMKVSGLCC